MKSVAEMTEQEMADARKWVAAWKRAAPELERMRRQDIRDADTIRSMPAFDGLFEAAVRDFPPKPTSGLVEQQRFFRKHRS
jgi:hypothetical protein